MRTTVSDIPEVSSARWRASSHSNGAGGNCVEVADGVQDRVPVRDSKAAPHGPELDFPAAAWAAFIGDLRQARRGRDSGS